jgi:hypothetical protein
MISFAVMTEKKNNTIKQKKEIKHYSDTVNEGYFACLLETDYDTILTFSANKDKRGIKSMLKSGVCIITKGGLNYSIIDSGIFTYKIRIYTNTGEYLDFWVPFEAIKNNKN